MVVGMRMRMRRMMMMMPCAVRSDLEHQVNYGP